MNIVLLFPQNYEIFHFPEWWLINYNYIPSKLRSISEDHWNQAVSKHLMRALINRPHRSRHEIRLDFILAMKNIPYTWEVKNFLCPCHVQELRKDGVYMIYSSEDPDNFYEVSDPILKKMFVKRYHKALELWKQKSV